MPIRHRFLDTGENTWFRTTNPSHNFRTSIFDTPTLHLGSIFYLHRAGSGGRIGDKTQLLSFVLAAKLRQPYPILAGIFVATLLNHALAASVGAWLASLISPQFLNWIVGLSFTGCGFCALKPDALEGNLRFFSAGAFVTTLIAFFLAEMGDKTQLATWLSRAL